MQPLAERLRPRTLDEYIGQKHLVGPSGNIFQKAKALVPILVPLFISAFRRADELATAMECRCYHGGEGRTKLHVLKYQRRDYVALAGGAVILALVVVLRRLGA